MEEVRKNKKEREKEEVRKMEEVRKNKKEREKEEVNEEG